MGQSRNVGTQSSISDPNGRRRSSGPATFESASSATSFAASPSVGRHTGARQPSEGRTEFARRCHPLPPELIDEYGWTQSGVGNAIPSRGPRVASKQETGYGPYVGRALG